MVTVLFLVARDARPNELIRQLQHDGHRVVQAEPRVDDFEPAAASVEADLDVIVVEGAHIPFRGREAASFLKDKKAFRDVPVIFYNTPDDQEDAARKAVPDVQFVDESGLAAAIGIAAK